MCGLISGLCSIGLCVCYFFWKEKEALFNAGNTLWAIKIGIGLVTALIHLFHLSNLNPFISQVHISLIVENWILPLPMTQPLVPKGPMTWPQLTFPALSLHSWNSI